MGATLAMIVTLALVLTLILVLLARIYCSLLLRCHRRPQLTTTAAATNTPPPDHTSTTSLQTLYSHGVLSAPRNLLFPSQTDSLDHKLNPKKQLFQQPTSPNQSISERSLQKISNSTSFDVDHHDQEEHHFVYISNPIFHNDHNDKRVEVVLDNVTPFETPNSSPSYLENGQEEEDDDEGSLYGSKWVVDTPPLSPMVKLPEEACSVSLRDEKSIVASESESNCNVNAPSSASSLGSPCTSPSW